MAPMLAVSAAVAILGGVGGIHLSPHARTAAGASIAAVLVVVCVAATGNARRSRAS